MLKKKKKKKPTEFYECMVCCQVQWVQLGKEDQGPLKREQEALLVLGHGGGSGAGRLVDNPLASQTRVDTGDTDVRQTPPPLAISPPSVQPRPLLELLAWLLWLHLPGGSRRRANKREIPREGFGTNRMDGNGKSEEPGEKAPASLPAYRPAALSPPLPGGPPCRQGPFSPSVS